MRAWHLLVGSQSTQCDEQMDLCSAVPRSRQAVVWLLQEMLWTLWQRADAIRKTDRSGVGMPGGTSVPFMGLAHRKLRPDMVEPNQSKTLEPLHSKKLGCVHRDTFLPVLALWDLPISKEMD